MIGRRKFITLVGGAAAAWPVAARAQQAGKLPVVGFVHPGTFGTMAHLSDAFRKGLGDGGYVQGQNVMVEYRFAENQLDRLPALVAQLIRLPVAAIAGPATSMQLAQSLTTTVPILFVSGSDPVSRSLVGSINRPGGNVTGVSFFSSEMGSKRLGLLREVMPKPAAIAYLMNPNFSERDIELADIKRQRMPLG